MNSMEFEKPKKIKDFERYFKNLSNWRNLPTMADQGTQRT